MRKAFIIFMFLANYLFGLEQVTLQLKWKNSFQFAGFYMAKEKGFYKEAGLDVNIKEMKKGINSIENVLKNPNMYGISDSTLVYWILKNKPIELLMPIFDHSPLVLVTTNPSIKSLKDIEKKKIAIGKFTIKTPSIIAMFKSKNINTSDLKTGKFGYSQKNLANKNRIFAIYEYDETYYLDKNHIKYRLFKPIDYGFDFYGDMLFTSKEELEKHPQRVKKMIEATKKGWEYAYTHVNETINVILKKYNTQNLTKEQLEDQANRMQKYMSKTFTFSINRLKSIAEMYFLLNIANNEVDISQCVYNSTSLTKKEKIFIKNHIIKCVTTASWEPFFTKRDGKLVGIAVDYWNDIRKKIGLKSVCSIQKSWSKVLNLIKNKKADITIATTSTEKRKKYAVFSKPYVSFPIVIATRNNVGFISDISLLKNRTVATGKNYTTNFLLKKYYPEIKIVATQNIDEALKLLSEKKVYAVADILPVLAYKINKYNYSDLKISGKTPWRFDVKIMVRKEYKQLIPAINKAIDSITENEKLQIYNKWVSVNYQKGYTFKDIINIIIIPIIIVLIVLGYALYLRMEIKKRELLENKLKKLATMDKLTNIYNRYKMDLSLDEQIEISKRYNRELSVIFFDIDHFKKINDKYGHKIGDSVLIELSRLVEKSIRKSDIFGRWGGEEFLIILPETSRIEAVKLAEKLRKKIEDHKFEKIKKLTCSFGVTNFKPNDTSESIMIRVDKNLYLAKQAGRNRIKFG